MLDLHLTLFLIFKRVIKYFFSEAFLQFCFIYNMSSFAQPTLSEQKP